MLSSNQFYLLFRSVAITALTVWLFAEVSRIPSPEIANIQEQKWAIFEQRAQRIQSLESQRSIEASAQQLLQNRPLDNRSLRLLAFVAEKRQNYQQAKLLMQLAVERSKADAVANAWLIEAHLTERNWDAALVHLDAGLRIYGPLLSALSPAVLFVSQNPTGAEALSERLKENPPWKKRFHRAFRNTQTAVSSTGAKPDKPRTPADQTDASTPPKIVHDVLRTMGANRENNRCAAAVEGRPPRSKSDRPCSGPPALLVLGPLHLQ